MDTTINLTSKRISAYLIDILFIVFVISLISQIRFINPSYDEYVESYSNYNELLEQYQKKEIDEEEFNKLYNENYYLVSKNGISYNIVIIVVIILYFGVFQKFNNGQTLGKKFMRIRVVDNLTNDNLGIFKYLIRILPIYFIYVGGILPLIINTILLFVLNSHNYVQISTIISYIFLGISISTFVMLAVRKDGRGLHDLLTNSKVIYLDNNRLTNEEKVIIESKG